jgi:hypothetical protein
MATRDSGAGVGFVLTLFASIWLVTDLILKLRDRIHAQRDMLLGFTADGAQLSADQRLYLLEAIWQSMTIVTAIIGGYALGLTILGLVLSRRDATSWVLVGFGLILLIIGVPVSLHVNRSFYDDWRKIACASTHASADSAAAWAQLAQPLRKGTPCA